MIERPPYYRQIKQPLPKRQALFCEKALDFSNLVGVVLIFEYGVNSQGVNIVLFLFGAVVFISFYGFVWYYMERFY